MPRKKKAYKTDNSKGNKKLSNSSDITLYDSADSPTPVIKLKKSVQTVRPGDLSWEQVHDEYNIVEEMDDNGTKKFVYKNKKNHSKSDDDVDNRPGVVYPEIVWYHIARFIKPEDICRFACINKSTYSMTKRENFWRMLYKKHCEYHPNLPERLRLENSFRTYGLRQRVIRALYHTNDVLVNRIAQQAAHDSKPHELVKQRCVNVWFYRRPKHWSIFFKFKKLYPHIKVETITKNDLLEELGRIDANPEESCQVLQV
jgi:hypothetical protein